MKILYYSYGRNKKTRRYLMKRLLVLFLIILWSLIFFNAATFTTTTKETTTTQAPGIKSPGLEMRGNQTGFGNIPLYFIPNRGQVHEKAEFYAKTPGYTLWMTGEGFVFDCVGKAGARDVS
ncbi:MAG TPA: hypothetical protein VK469_10795, partial [Candidatus Kapabacteria bacterium]|nr:hypothetical protein [Candidatus Kapabacteria bacterium]